MSDTIYANPTDQIEADILIDGESIVKDFPVIKIEVEKKINDIPKATVHLIDGDPASGDDSFKSATEIEIGKPIEIKAGYDTVTEVIFKGIISNKNIEQDKDGNPTMILECTDKAAALKEGKKTVAFHKKSDSEVVTSIVSDAGLDKSITIDSKAKFEQLIQFESSDWDFIQKRAQINGCILVPDDNTLTIASPKVTETAVRTLKYGDSIKEQSLTVSDANQPTKVTATCWDPAQQKMVEATATEPTVNEQGDSTGKKLSENKGTEHVLQTSNFLEQEALKAWADSYLNSLRLTKIGGRINTQGDPTFKPDTTVTLEGFGANYNGNGYIGAVKHTILPGEWETELELGLPDISINGGSESTESRVPTFKGLQIGVVKQIHEDPENTYRILVTIPAFPKITEGIWARLSSPYAPKEKGWFFYPEVGDELILGFVEGHPSHAIILGSLFSKKNTAPYTPDEDNSIKAIVTKNDLKIEFNDKDLITTISTPDGNEIVLSDKDENTTISTPNGNEIVLSDKDGKITITDENKHTITMSSSGISIESKGEIKLKATKDVIIEGKAIKMKASMALEGEGLDINFKAKKAIALEGTATAELKASGQTTVKGAILNLN